MWLSYEPDENLACRRQQHVILAARRRQITVRTQSAQRRLDTPEEPRLMAFISNSHLRQAFPQDSPTMFARCTTRATVVGDDWFLALVNNSSESNARHTSHYALSQEKKKEKWRRNNREMRCQARNGWHHGATLLGTGSSLAHSCALNSLPGSHCQWRSV